MPCPNPLRADGDYDDEKGFVPLLPSSMPLAPTFIPLSTPLVIVCNPSPTTCVRVALLIVWPTPLPAPPTASPAVNGG